MRYQDIRIGMKLTLKSERQQAYGMTTNKVIVTAMTARLHGGRQYKTPWVYGSTDDDDRDRAYFPSDFKS